MRKLLGAALFLLIVLMVLAALALQAWGIPGLAGFVAVVVATLIGLKFVVGALLKKLFTAPFIAKGAALRDAQVQVHSVTPAAAPVYEAEEEDAEDEEEPEEPDVPRDWYHLDVTITPPVPTGGFTHWEPGELVLTGPDAKSSRDLDSMDEEAAEPVAEVEIWRDGGWRPDEEGKYPGPQRLRLLAGVPVGTRRARFRYYFEVFGEIDLPSPAVGG